jgi:hypothetical protein
VAFTCGGFSVKFRLRLSGLHLLASAGVLSLVIGALYFGWYGWPGWYLLGADKLVGILVLVDAGLGPLATLVVSNPAKPGKELRRDITLIVFVQLAALGYGAGTLWVGRPLYYVYSQDRVEVVPAIAVDERSVELARQQGGRFIPGLFSLPQWVWAPLPEDPEERDRIISRVLFGGPDIVAMPQYYRPLKEGMVAMRTQFLTLKALSGHSGMGVAEYAALSAELARPEAELGVLPVQGRSHDGAWIFDRTTGEPLAFKPVLVWDARKQ